MSNNKLNCDSEIQSLKDQVDKQKRQISIFNNAKSLTEQNAADTNKLIAKANSSIFCGPGSDCYRNQKIDKLKKIYSEKQTNKDKLNQLFLSAEKGNFKNIVQTTNEPLVSNDFNHNPNSSIVDLSETKVINEKFCRVLAWYDNEWGFSNRLVDVASILK